MSLALKIAAVAVVSIIVVRCEICIKIIEALKSKENESGKYKTSDGPPVFSE